MFKKIDKINFLKMLQDKKIKLITSCYAYKKESIYKILNDIDYNKILDITLNTYYTINIWKNNITCYINNNYCYVEKIDNNDYKTSIYLIIK